MKPQAAGDLRVLFSREQIATRVAQLGAEISRDFAGQPIVLVGVLKGATIFLSDLARNISLDATFDFLAVSSYGKGTQSEGVVRLIKDLDEPIKDKNLLLVEDILDTGLTVTFLKKLLQARDPRSLRVVALLNKPSRRIETVEADYVGFTIANEFAVGYGMDINEQYRNLPDICALSPDLLRRHGLD